LYYYTVAKTNCPTDHLPEEWTGCGACGLKDSQNHWIRECQVTSIRSIRSSTISKVKEQLDGILYGKGRKTIRREIFNICSEITELALNVDGGEKVSVGILPEALVNSIDPQLSRLALQADKMLIPNQWKTCITRILTILKEGAQKCGKPKRQLDVKHCTPPNKIS